MTLFPSCADKGQAIKCPDGVKIQVKADIGFINENPPQRFAGKLVYVCLLAETSDGRKIHFARIGFVVTIMAWNLPDCDQWTEAWTGTNSELLCASHRARSEHQLLRDV
jgi:hypothetical protein